MIFQTLSFQQSIYDWARDHRVHHKFTDTDADPHNSRRGEFLIVENFSFIYEMTKYIIIFFS